jgi:hypothetical protein
LIGRLHELLEPGRRAHAGRCTPLASFYIKPLQRASQAQLDVVQLDLQQISVPSAGRPRASLRSVISCANTSGFQQFNWQTGLLHSGMRPLR